MMGREISDPHGIEGTTPHIKGLDILPVSTILGAHKKTEQCHFSFEANPTIKGYGYEIHMGTTSSEQALCRLNTGEPDGCYLNSHTWGSYIHGIFDNASVIESVLKGIEPSISVTVSYRDIKEKGYNQLADLIRQKVNMPYIYEILNQ